MSFPPLAYILTNTHDRPPLVVDKVLIYYWSTEYVLVVLKRLRMSSIGIQNNEIQNLVIFA